MAIFDHNGKRITKEQAKEFHRIRNEYRVYYLISPDELVKAGPYFGSYPRTQPYVGWIVVGFEAEVVGHVVEDVDGEQ